MQKCQARSPTFTKSLLNSFSIHDRGHSNLTCTPTTVSTSYFLVQSGGANALVIPTLGQKELLHCQSMGCASSTGLQTKLVEAVDARLTDAQKLCLPGLSTGPSALT